MCKKRKLITGSDEIIEKFLNYLGLSDVYVTEMEVILKPLQYIKVICHINIWEPNKGDYDAAIKEIKKFKLVPITDSELEVDVD